jgi:hypothetical protein
VKHEREAAADDGDPADEAANLDGASVKEPTGLEAFRADIHDLAGPVDFGAKLTEQMVGVGTLGLGAKLTEQMVGVGTLGLGAKLTEQMVGVGTLGLGAKLTEQMVGVGGLRIADLLFADLISTAQANRSMSGPSTADSVQPPALTRSQWIACYLMVQLIVYLVVLNTELRIEAQGESTAGKVLEILSLLDLGRQVAPLALGLAAGRLFKRFGPEQPTS